MSVSTTPRARLGLAWLLLAAALLMRAAIPQGYMAEAAADGAVTITVCHSDAVLTIPLGKKDKGESREQQPCAFASLATGDAPGPDAFDLPLPRATVESFTTAEAPFALAAAARQLPPARAPPAKA